MDERHNTATRFFFLFSIINVISHRAGVKLSLVYFKKVFILLSLLLLLLVLFSGINALMTWQWIVIWVGNKTGKNIHHMVFNTSFFLEIVLGREI